MAVMLKKEQVSPSSKPELSERVTKAKSELFSATPRVDIERVKFLLEAYQETHGQPVVVQRARYFEKLCHEKTIFIDDNPVVGTLTKYAYGGYPFFEIGCRWMARAQTMRLPLGEAQLTDEEREWINKGVEAWKDKNIFNRTRDVLLRSIGVDIAVLQKTGVGTELTPGGIMSTFPDYEAVLKKGLLGIIAEAEEHKQRLDIGNPDDMKKFYFLDSAVTCLKAMIHLGKRYAALARELAASESSGERQRELLQIAEICERVPGHPARTFQEALQSAWFMMLGAWFENPSIGNACPMRFSVYLYPFYQKDKMAGRITDDKAIELMQLYFLRCQGLGQVLPPHGFKYSQSRVALHLGLGGLTPDGKDATNELDWLILKAKKALGTPEPLLYLVYHDKLSQEFLLQCLDLVKTGMGQPAFFDSNKLVQRNLLHRPGISLQEARNTAIIPCVQDIVAGSSDSFWEGHLSIPKMLELVLNNGKDPLTGVKVGLETGEIDSFKSPEDVLQAFYQQLAHFIPLMRMISRTAWNIVRDCPLPFGSSLVNDCIQKGQDMTDGGARYSLANGTSFTGVVDAANSLMAITQVVFEQKKLSLEQLREVLAANFEGHEEVRKMCLEAPKYGNDNEATDTLVTEVYDFCWEKHQAYPDFLGRHIIPEAYSVSTHGALGEMAGALPNGRRAITAFTDATVSAQPGTDTHGPTALIKSAARVIDTVKFGSNHLNVKFHPSALEGAESGRKFLSLIKTYMDLGGYHVQFNCVNAATLRQALQDPEEYRDLVVRVAGFSAYFLLLDPVIQQEIIARTELHF